METGIIRAIDASINRAREGLRVVEDYVRMVLDDRHLTELLKSFRHRLTAATDRVPAVDRLAARETSADVGTGVTLPSERDRRTDADLIAANLARLQESLRSIEEFAKRLDPELAAAVEQLRYESYTLERAIGITVSSVERLADVRLYVLIDDFGGDIERFDRTVRLLIESGVDALQLRAPGLDDRRLVETAHRLRELTSGTRTLMIVNDRPDIARVTHADGVHVGQEELTVKDARTIVGPQALIGVSTHNISQARQAVIDGANYIGAGPTFPSRTKKFDDFPGLEYLKQVAEEIRLPAFAIGGITKENLPKVLETGIQRIAVTSAVTESPTPEEAAKAAAELKRILGSGE